jgi:isopentenyl phosphate kinase
VQIATENNKGKENIFPDSNGNYKTEIKRNEDITEGMEGNLRTQFQLQKETKCVKVMKMIKENHKKNSELNSAWEK